MSAAQPQQQSRADLDELLALKDPVCPSRPVPRLLRRLLPDPLRCFEDLQRFRHADLDEMPPAAKAWEAMRIRTATALVEDTERVPIWCIERLERLAS